MLTVKLNKDGKGFLRAFIPSLILISLILPSTAMWYQSLRVNVTVKTGDSSWSIGSYKGFKIISSENCGCQANICKGLSNDEMLLSSNRKIFKVVINTAQEAHSASCSCSQTSGNVRELWIGLVLKNDGSLPLKFKGVSVISTGLESPTSWDMNVYVYGPTKHGLGNQNYWGNVCCYLLPYPGNVELPLFVKPGYKAVVWIDISISGTGNFTFTFNPVFTSFNEY